MNNDKIIKLLQINILLKIKIFVKNIFKKRSRLFENILIHITHARKMIKFELYYYIYITLIIVYTAIILQVGANSKFEFNKF